VLFHGLKCAASGRCLGLQRFCTPWVQARARWNIRRNDLCLWISVSRHHTWPQFIILERQFIVLEPQAGWQNRRKDDDDLIILRLKLAEMCTYLLLIFFLCLAQLQLQFCISNHEFLVWLRMYRQSLTYTENHCIIVIKRMHRNTSAMPHLKILSTHAKVSHTHICMNSRCLHPPDVTQRLRSFCGWSLKLTARMCTCWNAMMSSFPHFCSNPKFVTHSPSIPVPGILETAQEAF